MTICDYIDKANALDKHFSKDSEESTKVLGLLVGFRGGRNGEGEMEMAKEEKGTKEKVRKEKEREKGGGWNLKGGVCVMGFRGNRRPCIQLVLASVRD